ncbi:MAG: nucleoside hydrolase [Rikenellaceae bacterium]|nr:nucleoside hydrolase [Rikenellaceae bacterium]
MKKLILTLAVAFTTIFAVQAAKPVKIIFDTDMGNDVDDVVALDMLYKYVDEGTIDLLGILSSKREAGSIKFIDAMNTIYGHPNIPIGIAKTYPSENYVCTDKKLNYADYTVAQHNYPHTIKDWDAVEDGYKLLRRLLSKEEDGSVTLVMVGFSTNLVRMLDSKADEYSELDGKSLLAKKLDKVVIMAGNFREKRKEYNVWNDHYAAVRFYAECPVPMLFTDVVLGKSVLYPYQTVYEGFKYFENHPLPVSFHYYAKMPYNRPLWDPTAVLFAAEGHKGYASLSKKGYVTVDQKSITDFTVDKHSNRQYYEVNDAQRAAIVRRVVELTMRSPKNPYNKK